MRILKNQRQHEIKNLTKAIRTKPFSIQLFNLAFLFNYLIPQFVLTLLQMGGEGDLVLFSNLLSQELVLIESKHGAPVEVHTHMTMGTSPVLTMEAMDHL